MESLLPRSSASSSSIPIPSASSFCLRWSSRNWRMLKTSLWVDVCLGLADSLVLPPLEGNHLTKGTRTRKPGWVCDAKTVTEDSFLTLSPCFYTSRHLFLFFYFGFLFPQILEHKGGIYFSTETYAVTYCSYHVPDILLLTYIHFKINPHQKWTIVVE